MDDFRIIIYIVGALIYFFVKNKRKKAQEATNQPPVSKRPTISSERKSFEDLLKEITEQANQKKQEQEEEFFEPEVQTRKTYDEREEEVEHKPISSQSRRTFADDESRKVYERSIKQAEGFDLKFEENAKYHSKKLKTSHLNHSTSPKKNQLAKEIREGLRGDTAKKAVIYSEILNRKF